MEMTFKVQVKIQKPLSEVFDAVYNPEKLAGYFVHKAQAPLDEGKSVMWTFKDSNDEITFPVHVKKLVKNELLVFDWEASEGSFDAKEGKYPSPGGYDTRVEMNFEATNPNETIITIKEGGWKATQGGLEGSYGNCGGWMHMGLCLKAYLEYGINLRKGSF